MTFAPTVLGEVLKGPRLHHNFQTPTCFSPFLLGSPQRQLHTLFQNVVYNSGLSGCLYSTHEWLGNQNANCYLTEPTIMACHFLFATFLCINVLSLTIHFNYCGFGVDFAARFKLFNACVQWDLILSWGPSLTMQYKYIVFQHFFVWLLPHSEGVLLLFLNSYLTY